MKFSRGWTLVVVFAGFGGLSACGSSATETQTDTTPVAVQEEPPPAEEQPEPEPTDVHIEGDHLTIDRHINFESDSDVILSESNELLDHIATMLSLHQTDIAHLRVIGHTDAAGGHDHNQELSERRAAAVVSALQQRGVTATLDASGDGEATPLCQEDTDECHAQNRRVEFVIVAD